MKQSIYVSLIVLAGIFIWTAGEALIFLSALNGNESLFVGFIYFLIVLFLTYSIALDVAYKYRKRHATKLDQSIDLSSIVSDDLYIATADRL